MKFLRKLGAVAALSILASFANPGGAIAQVPRNITMTVGVCDPVYPQRCVKPDTNGATPVTMGAVPTGGATAANQTAVQANAGSDATKAMAVQGVTGGKAVGVNLAATTAGGCTPGGYQSAASTNATNIKASAGTFCGGVAINTTATLYYLRFYDLASAPTCSSATGFIATIPVPASATGAGTMISTGSFGWAFTAGIGFCLTGGGTSTDNTNAATGVFVAYSFK